MIVEIDLFKAYSKEGYEKGTYFTYTCFEQLNLFASEFKMQWDEKVVFVSVVPSEVVTMKTPMPSLVVLRFRKLKHTFHLHVFFQNDTKWMEHSKTQTI